MSGQNPDHHKDGRNDNTIPILLTPEEQARIEAQKREDARQETENAFKERQVTATEAANRLSSRSLLVAIISGVIAVFACWGTWYQGHVTRSTLTELSKQTKTAQRAAFAACVGSQVSRAALLQAIEAGKDAHDSATASTYQTIVATESEAAYISPKMSKSQIVPGAPILVDFGIKNTGKTAASHVITKVRVMLVHRDDNPSFTYPKNQIAYLETPRLEAGDEPVSLTNDPTVPLWQSDHTRKSPTMEEINDLAQSRQFLLFFLRVTYVDALGINHWVNFCRTVPPITQLSKHQRAPEKCIRYNEEDHNNAMSLANVTAIPPTNIPDIACPIPEDK